MIVFSVSSFTSLNAATRTSNFNTRHRHRHHRHRHHHRRRKTCVHHRAKVATTTATSTTTTTTTRRRRRRRLGGEPSRGRPRASRQTCRPFLPPLIVFFFFFARRCLCKRRQIARGKRARERCAKTSAPRGRRARERDRRRRRRVQRFRVHGRRRPLAEPTLASRGREQRQFRLILHLR